MPGSLLSSALSGLISALPLPLAVAVPAEDEDATAVRLAQIDATCAEVRLLWFSPAVIAQAAV
jgi:hypothetical protein